MRVFDRFRKKGTLKGRVVIQGLPQTKMYSVSVTLFRASSNDEAHPYGGEPPGNAYIDEVVVKEENDEAGSKLEFEIRRPCGYYHIDVGVIAYLERKDKMYAQVEHFFPNEKPYHLKSDGTEDVLLAVNWPDIPFDELGHYGTVHPQP